VTIQRRSAIKVGQRLGLHHLKAHLLKGAGNSVLGSRAS
jgi:hypothetical protein